MSTDTQVRTRRAVLGAALGGAAAVAAQGLAAAAPVAATTGGNALIGNANTGDALTSFENTDAGEESLAGLHSGAGTGIRGESVTGTGIRAASTDTTPTADFNVASHKTGLIGAAGDTTNLAENTDETGVYGYASLSDASSGVWGDSGAGFGVYGSGLTGVGGYGDWGVYGSGLAGVIGDVPAIGVGVYGFTGNVDLPEPPSGIGVYARAATNSLTALQVQGRAKFSRSGRTSMSTSSKTVTLSGVSASSTFVVATLQTSVSGLYVRAVVPASGSFKIYLSKSPGKTVSVGWIAFEKP